MRPDVLQWWRIARKKRNRGTHLLFGQLRIIRVSGRDYSLSRGGKHRSWRQRKRDASRWFAQWKKAVGNVLCDGTAVVAWLSIPLFAFFFSTSLLRSLESLHFCRAFHFTHRIPFHPSPSFLRTETERWMCDLAEFFLPLLLLSILPCVVSVSTFFATDVDRVRVPLRGTLNELCWLLSGLISPTKGQKRGRMT